MAWLRKRRRGAWVACWSRWEKAARQTTRATSTSRPSCQQNSKWKSEISLSSRNTAETWQATLRWSRTTKSLRNRWIICRSCLGTTAHSTCKQNSLASHLTRLAIKTKSCCRPTSPNLRRTSRSQFLSTMLAKYCGIRSFAKETGR